MLPTQIYVVPEDVDKEWNEMDECDKEEAVSNFLSNEFELCHKGFQYEEAHGYIRIFNIEWDEEE